MNLVETFIAMDSNDIFDLMIKVIIFAVPVSMILSIFKKSTKIESKLNERDDEEVVVNPKIKLKEIRDMSKLLSELINKECILFYEYEEIKGIIIKVEETLVKIRTTNKKDITKDEILKIALIDKVEII